MKTFDELMADYIKHLRKMWTYRDMSINDKKKAKIEAHKDYTLEKFEAIMTETFPSRLPIGHPNRVD